MGLLAAAGFLSSAGARVIDSLLVPVATDFRIGIAATSVLLAAFTLPYGMLQLVVGPLGDRFGKLRTLVAALLFYALATLGCALAPNLSSLTLLRAAAGAASAGLIPVCLAYIGDVTSYSDRQVTLSRFLTGVVVAQMLAGPAGGAFGQYLSWRGVFLLLAAAALLLAGILATRIGRWPAAALRSPMRLRSYRRLARGRPALLLAATFVDGMVFTGCIPFIAPFLTERFGLSYLAVGLVVACVGVGALVYIQNAQRLLARLGEHGLVLAGAAVAASGLAIGMLSQDWEVFILVEAMLGLGYFMLHAVLQARATELLPEARATATSGFAFMLFLGQAAGALLTGFGIATFGAPTVFWIDAGSILLLGAWLWAMLRD